MSELENLPQRPTLQQWAGARPGKPVQLALLFTDILGSTKCCNEMGDRDWIDVLVSHFRQARSLLCDDSSFEIKIIGDSFMVAFETATDALHFAAEFLKNTGHPRVRIRAGIHVGAARVIENDIFGGMVNYAARVTQWHKEEGIAVSDSAKEQIENELGSTHVKQRFIRVTHQFDDFAEAKTLWRYNRDALWDRRIKQDFPSLTDLARQNAGPVISYQFEPATSDDLVWFAEIESEAYGQDAVPLEVMQAWYQRNPTGFVTIKWQDQRVGHINILPVRPNSLQPLLDGRITEKELSLEAICTPAERGLNQDLYVESIIICPPAGQNRTPAVYALLSEFGSIAARICNTANVCRVFAIAATSAGERLVRQLGFEEVASGRDRVDGHPFFMARFDDIVANIDTLVGT